VFDRDGEAETVVGTYFDLIRWALRYLVLRHGSLGRDILVSPQISGQIRWPERRIVLRLFDEEIEAAPSVDPDQRITRGQEKSCNEYFFLPDYWVGEDLWGEEKSPTELRTGLRSAQSNSRTDGDEKSYLLSGSEMKEYSLQCPQGTIGGVEDFLWNLDNFAIRFLMIDVGGFLSPKKTLLSPLWVTSVNRGEQELGVELPKDAIENAPAYEAGEPLTPAYERNLMSHYNDLQYKT
jgi:hypothetical protein